MGGHRQEQEPEGGEPDSEVTGTPTEIPLPVKAMNKKKLKLTILLIFAPPLQ